jgi:hypothetical protein
MFRPLLGSSSGVHLKVKITNRMTVLVIKYVKKFLQFTCGSLFRTLIQELDVFVLLVGTLLCLLATLTFKCVPEDDPTRVETC